MVSAMVAIIDIIFPVDNHFTAHCEMIFAVIILQFAVIDLQFVVINLQFAVISLQFATGLEVWFAL